MPQHKFRVQAVLPQPWPLTLPRPSLLCHAQALCTQAYRTSQSPLVRQSTGVSKDRFMQLVHVMSKIIPSCKGLSYQHIYCSVVRGAQVGLVFVGAEGITGLKCQPGMQVACWMYGSVV